MYFVYRNLKHQKWKSVLQIILIALVAFVLFAGRQLAQSLENGLQSTSQRAGADIIVVPENYVSSVQNALFTGEPCTVYFDSGWLEQVKLVDGVAQASPQIFLATLSYASCCDSAVQMIAIDTATDFTVAPWLQEATGGRLTEELGPYEIIVGSNLKYQPGDEATFYGQKFQVIGKLSETGMGYDKSVFMSIDTARELTHTDVVKNYFALKEGSSQISAINIKVADGYDRAQVAEAIQEAGGDEIQVLTSQQLVAGMKSSIEKYRYIFGIAEVMLYIVGVLSVTAVFALNIQSRTKEFGIWYTLGAGKKILLFQIIKEAAVLCLSGTLLGAATASVLLLAYGNYLKSRLDLPFLSPGLLDQLKNFGICLGIMLPAILISAAAAYGVLALNEPDKLLREG